MIKLKIERYRDFTEDEIKARENWKRENNRFNNSRMEDIPVVGLYQENVLDVELTDEQFVAIKKAVLENF